MFFMFIYITAGLAAYILSVLLHLLYITFFLHILHFFGGVSGDTTAPTLASPLMNGELLVAAMPRGSLVRAFASRLHPCLLLLPSGLMG